MWLMGFVGDRLGRASGMIITLSLSVVGALGSGLLSWGNNIALFSTISAFRFVLGFGIGGTFPLSATQAAEGAEGLSIAGKRLTTGMSYRCPCLSALYGTCVSLIIACVTAATAAKLWVTYSLTSWSTSCGLPPQPSVSASVLSVVPL